MQSILIIGANGSMGKRYQAILRHFDIEPICCDINHDEKTIISTALNSDKIILCTPTPSHYELLKRLIPIGKPILCEKPISTNLENIKDIFTLCHKHNCKFTMMFQYTELVDDRFQGESFYDYFRTGKDGLIWDCLQIIGLAKDDCQISNSSPIWTCKINGKVLSLADMDYAYLNFVRKWLDDKIIQDYEQLYNIHKKVDEIYYERFSDLN